MKKQINPTIKAHLIRSAFYLLLLLAIVAIPFALAQSRSRGTARETMAKRATVLEPAESKGLAIPMNPDSQSISPKTDPLMKAPEEPVLENPDPDRLNYPAPPSPTLTGARSDYQSLKWRGVVPCGANNIRVEATGGTNADYATLKEAFDAINAGTHTGVIIIGVCFDTTETAPAVLNASGTGGASYTSVLIAPNGVRIISGAMPDGSPLVDLNGADNVTIDGSNALSFSNTNNSAVAGTSTIRLINGAQNNTITNCAIVGSSTTAVGTAGGTILISTSTGGANSNNTISNNNIGPALGGLPTKGVMSLGSASPNNNSGNLIDNNNIYDFFSPTVTVAGISISTNTDTTTISNNRIFQTLARTFTGAGLRYNGILVSPGSGGSANITGNTIGFSASNGTGTTTITGSSNTINAIAAPSTSTTAVTNIQGNIISGFNQTTSTGTTSSGSAFIGISVGATAGAFHIGDIAGNTIGSLDGSSSIVLNNTTTTANTWAFLGIFDFSFQSGDIISNNNIGTITINNGG